MFEWGGWWRQKIVEWWQEELMRVTRCYDDGKKNIDYGPPQKLMIACVNQHGHM
jgi:hypothetical protein